MTTQTQTRPSVTGATEALDKYLADKGTGGPRPPLRYLRRKPGRGLVAVFGAGAGGDVYTVTVDERSLAEATVREFPADPKLPQLDVVMAPGEHRFLADALEAAARGMHGVPADLPLLDVAAEPVRYKPGDRCVLRYRLRFGNGRTGTLVAKLYREPHEAQAADDLLVRLRAAGAAAGWTARPLGVVPGLPLALTEDVGSGRDPVPARSGLDVVRPGSPEAFDVIARAARALAELHTSGGDGGPATRTAGDEAAKAARRAGLLEQYVPALASRVREVAGALGDALTALPGDPVRPAHGSYKSSQLLVRDGAVFLVDFDQFCQADPALDVGYFLAYLRPAGFWYHRAALQGWFEAATEAFLSAYLERLAEAGEPEETRAGIARRACVFEAALLLKIAARRVNRLHSPRPGEVAAVLDEVSRCLARAERPAPAGG